MDWVVSGCVVNMCRSESSNSICPSIRLSARRLAGYDPWHEQRPQETQRGVLGDHMTIIFMIFGVACAAFCVWLTVRIVNRRQRWAKWLALGLVVLLAYPLSFGPACALVDHRVLPCHQVALAYRPLIHFTWCATNPSYLDLPCESLYQYSRLFAENSVLYSMWNETLVDAPESTR